MSEANEIMTVKDLAAYLKCHQSTIYRLLKKGAIPASKLGSDWRFRKSAIDYWMNEREQAGYV